MEAKRPILTIILLPQRFLRQAASADNGLKKHSKVMVDKATTVPREKVGQAFGRLDDTTLVGVNRGLAVFLGFA